jgi:tetratricopeptide (TPR) repeat protein
MQSHVNLSRLEMDKTVRTLAIVIGLSHYKSSLLGKLPAAAADARRVAHSLASWGVHMENINLLTDADATRREILKALRVWPLQKACNYLRLIIYFAGHGSRMQDPGQLPVSVLLPYDADPSDRIGTGIILPDILGALTRIRPREVYLFLDACSLRFDRIENVTRAELPEKDVLNTIGSSCMFCMVAAGLEKSYEDLDTYSGYFTQSILSNLSKLRKTKSNCSILAAEVKDDLKKQGLAAPEYYIFGNINGWPLPSPDTEEPIQNVPEDIDDVPRISALASLQDFIIDNRGKLIWVWGKSGLGKTILVRQLQSLSKNSIYVSVPYSSENATIDINEYIASEISEQIIDLFPSGKPLLGNPINTLAEVSKKMPGSLLLIDHAERFQEGYAQKLIDTLFFIKSLDIILISQKPPHLSFQIVGWQCPVLSEDEVKLFCKQYDSDIKLSVSFLKSASKGMPINLRRMLDAGLKSPADFVQLTQSPGIIKAILALSQSGGYVDEILFRTIFELELGDLSFLGNLGLIHLAENHYIPHDSLMEMSLESRADISKDKSIIYWSCQVKETPQDLWSCRMLANVILKYGFIQEADKALLIAVELLVRARDWTLVKSIGLKLLSYSHLSPTLFYISEELVKVTKYELVDIIVEHLERFDLDADQEINVYLIKSERHFWYGNYDEAVSLAQKILSLSGSPKQFAQAHLNIGIAHFFMGEWTEALKHFRQAEYLATSEPRIHGWVKLMVGSIFAILGIEASEGRYLLQSAVIILTQIDDFAGVASAWNNLGEMSWKLGEYRTSLIQLSNSYRAAEMVDDKSTLLESTRNMLHVHLRLNGPFSTELEETLNKLYIHLSDVPDRTEQMQVWNTLATIAAYRGDIDDLSTKVDLACRYTKGNVEYHMYTLTNQALLAALLNNTDLSLKILLQAFAFAKQGCNYLAIKQMQNDVSYLLRNYGNLALEELANEMNNMIYQYEKDMRSSHLKLISNYRK